MKRKLITLVLALLLVMCTACFIACDGDDSSSTDNGQQQEQVGDNNQSGGNDSSSNSNNDDENNQVSDTDSSNDNDNQSNDNSGDSNDDDGNGDDHGGDNSGDSSGDDEDDTTGLSYAISADGTYAICDGRYTSTDKDIVIASTYKNLPVKVIDSTAFTDYSCLERVTIPNSVTSIRLSAFYGLNNLKTVTFESNSKLENIGNYAFYGCTSLENIEIPSGVKVIGYSAFEGCNSLPCYEYGNAIYFGNSQNKYLILKKAKTTNITSCEINFNTRIIYDSAFEECDNLESITIPNSVISIGDYAFSYCWRVKNVEIPKSVTSIGRGAFCRLWDLENITVEDGNEIYHSKDNCVIETASNTLIAGCKNSIIPNTVTKIDTAAFDGCIDLKSVEIPKSVTSIGNGAFQNCSGLESIVIPDKVTSIGSFAFQGCNNLKTVMLENTSLESIGEDAFYNCKNLDIVYYKGTKDDFNRIQIGSGNGELDNVEKWCFYSETAPTDDGLYWCETELGKKYWGLEYTMFQANEYQSQLEEIITDKNTSLAYAHLNEIQSDSSFMSELETWELAHLVTSPSSATDKIEKDKLYLIALFDILGVSSENKSEIFANVENEAFNFAYSAVKDIIGDGDKEVLKAQKANIDDLKKVKLFKGLGVLEEIVGVCTNMEEAITLCAQYKALANMNQGYCDVLREIVSRNDVDSYLKKAAETCIHYFEDGANQTLLSMITTDFVKKEMIDLAGKLIDTAWDLAMTALIPGYNVVSFAVKGMLFLGEELFNMDERCQQYYLMQTTVQLEHVLRDIIEEKKSVNFIDVENKDLAQTYMCSIELFNNSIYRGFDCVAEYYQTYVDAPAYSSDIKDEAEEQIQIANLGKENRIELYERFEWAVQQKYNLIYA